MFGKVQTIPQNEDTPFYPRSPYGCAKLYAHWMTVNYRESYNMFCCSGILFNHESELRGKEFVTRKITSLAAVQKLAIENKEIQKIEPIQIGNIDAERDWGYAKEYVEGMWLMLQQDTPDDYVLATGETTSIRVFIGYVYDALGIPTRWEGAGLDEKLIHAETDVVLLEINPDFFRPAEVDLLLGSPDKATKKMGWQPKTKIKELAEIMAKADYDMIKK
jgi:GDPmannose 4,6-dehydratase